MACFNAFKMLNIESKNGVSGEGQVLLLALYVSVVYFGDN